ncbi:MAG: hypothetical protein R3B97_13090 [Dehalococcoidia bacterium]
MNASQPFEVVRLDGAGAAAAAPELAAVLRDCVEGGASVSFLSPLTPARAKAFWASVAAAVAQGGTALIVARDVEGIQGTV